MKVPRLQFPSFCWLFVFLLALTRKTRGANTTPVWHIFICTFFSELKNVDRKKLHKAVCLPQSSFTPVFCVCMCVRASVCVQTTLQLETHCWISPRSRKSLYKSISVRYIGIMLPVICLTSCFFARVSMPSRLSRWWGEQPVLSREGSCLAGATGSGPREETSTGIFWRGLSVSHASSRA